jgi:hypothetical protein
MNRDKLGQEWLHMWGAGITVAITGRRALACGTEGRQATKNVWYSVGRKDVGDPYDTL